MSSLELALALAKLDIYVFPFRITSTGEKRPLTQHGHLDATTDPEQIATWYTLDFPNALVGVAAGPSGLIAADIDRKDGKDGAVALQNAWLNLPDTYEHPTPTNGLHKVYTAPEGVRLAPSKNYEGVEGLDIRAGSSWLGWYGDAPASRDVFAPAPEWLCKPARDVIGGAFEGDLDDWLESLGSADDEPDGRVLDAIGRIPDTDFGHTELIERQFEFVRLGAEGALGVRHGLDLLRAEWLREPWDTDANRYEFDAGLDGAIKKYGAVEQQIAELPPYAEALERALGAGLDNALVFGAAKDKAHYFRVIRALVPLTLNNEDIAAVVWGAPTTKSLAREWGIDYLFEQIDLAHKQWEADSAPRENTLTVSAPRSAAFGILLSEEEREILKAHPTFIDRYLAWVRKTLPLANTNYHRTCALTILSLAFGGVAFIPVTASKKMPVNLFQFNLGGSSTGKSDAITMQKNVLRPMFANDPAYDMGADVSPEALHEALLTRDGVQAYFHTDEAARLFKGMAKAGGYMDRLNDDLTHYYDGYVPPVRKKSAKDVSGRSAIVSVTSQFFGTPEWTMKYLDEDMILSGFLARYLWSFGDGVVTDEREFDELQADEETANQANDPTGVAFAEELLTLRSRLGTRRPVLGTEAALKRLAENTKAMKEQLEAEENWRLYESPYRRMKDAVRKTAALIALSRGAVKFDVPDVLAAIEQAEVWMDGLRQAVSMLAGSQFSREVEQIAEFVRTKGRVPGERLYAAFSKLELRDYVARIEAAKARGLIVEKSVNGKLGYEWNIDTAPAEE